MRKLRITTILLIILVLIVFTACGNSNESPTEVELAEEETSEQTSSDLETEDIITIEFDGLDSAILQFNENDNQKSYPYFVETSSATWYLSADDIEVQGLDTMLSELSEIVPLAELDFSEARNVLGSYIDERIPPIDIYTDFAGNANATKTNSAIYMEASNYIKVFGGWDEESNTMNLERYEYINAA